MIKIKRVELLLAIGALFFMKPVNAQLLWKVECDSCAQPSYLFGTYHNIGGKYIGEHLSVAQIAFKVDAIVTESERAAYKEQEFVSPDSFLTKVPLNMLLDSADYSMAKDTFTKYFILPFDSVKYMNPLSLEVALRYARESYRLYANKLKPDSIIAIPMDESFKKIAIGRKILLYALDEPGSLDRMKNKEIPLAEQAQMMMIELKGPADKQLYHVWDSCYHANDLYCICNSEAGAMTHSRPGDSILLTKRNMLWMEKIPALIQKQSTLIAVGAMHLCGNDGLLNLLYRKKYKLTPLANK
ncbi:MAG: TraB/GumN family protein [Bacteroidota bacterium]